MNISGDRDDVLCVNMGSSSLKFALFSSDPEGLRAIASGAVEGIGLAAGTAWLDASGERRELTGAYADHPAAIDAAFRMLAEAGVPAPTVAAHRIVHGGPRYAAPVFVDAAVIADLKELTALAPLHLPASIAGIDAIKARHPQLPQVACFDTAFHASMPEVARRLPLPRRFDEEGVRRYGFHGLSYEYVMSALGPDFPPRIVIAHLGNGSSLVAVRDGQAIDTTMGFTPDGGVIMGTRTGDLDPGALLYLLRHEKLSPDELAHIVERESGLLAIGGTSDMKTLLERAETDALANLAIRMFGYSVRKAIGSLSAALGGIDLLVFTGGIGEHAALVRSEACGGLEFLGLDLDLDRNQRPKGKGQVSTDSSPCAIRVIATNEDLVLARHAVRLRRGAS